MADFNNCTLILRSSDIEKIIQEVGIDEVMDQLIDRMFAAFKAFDPEKIDIPVRSGFHYQRPENGLIEWMPLYDRGKQVLVKMVGYHPDNPRKHHLPTILSTISSYDTKTGHLMSLVDGVLLTAFRTGAASAVASKIFAKRDSKCLGLIGCGAQGVTQLHAISRIFELDEVLFFDRDKKTNDNFLQRVEMLNLNTNFRPVKIEELVQQADILCTATSIDVGTGPLFSNVTTQAHLHVNAVGSDFPGKTELPLNLLKNCFVCPDFTAQAVVEGECQQLSPEDIGPDIFECVKNEGPYEYLKNRMTVFDSTGLPLEDLVAKNLFQDFAAKMGLGLEVAIENISEDVKNPYHFLRAPLSTIVTEPLKSF